MPVVPQETEVEEITSGGFVLVDGPFEHSFYAGGYGALYQAPQQPAKEQKKNASAL